MIIELIHFKLMKMRYLNNVEYAIKYEFFNFERLLKHNNRFYISKDDVIRKKFINKYHDNFLIKYFDVVKSHEFFIRKYY